MRPDTLLPLSSADLRSSCASIGGSVTVKLFVFTLEFLMLLNATYGP